MDCSLDIVEDLKTKQNIHMALSSFKDQPLIWYTVLTHISTKPLPGIGNSLPPQEAHSTSSCSDSTQIPCMSWTLSPESSLNAPSLYPLIPNNTSSDSFRAHVKVSLYQLNFSQVRSLVWWKNYIVLWTRYNSQLWHFLYHVLLGIFISGLKFLLCQMGSQYPPHRK